MTGKIIKGIAGFYYVNVAGSGIYECRAKGIFRKEGVKPLVGDDVEIEVTHEQDMEASVVHILPRRNSITRPAAANIDQAILIFALDDPKPSAGVIDRFLIRLLDQGLDPVICFNKNDLSDEEEARKWLTIYADAGYRTLACSAAAGEGLDEIRELLKGRTSIFAGPSGVGKSSLINIFAPEAQMETGITSKKLGRGKHTTRHTELFMAGENTFIMDTPGFTSFEAEYMNKEELKSFYPEFYPYEGSCRFAGCVHINEPDCPVKDAVNAGKIHKERYGSYIQLFEELKEAEKHRY